MKCFLWQAPNFTPQHLNRFKNLLAGKVVVRAIKSLSFFPHSTQNFMADIFKYHSIKSFKDFLQFFSSLECHEFTSENFFTLVEVHPRSIAGLTGWARVQSPARSGFFLILIMVGLHSSLKGAVSVFAGMLQSGNGRSYNPSRLTSDPLSRTRNY